MKASKIEIHQVEQEQGVFTEILVDGHRLEGVRSFELKQEVGNSMPTLSIDLNALNLSTDLKLLQVNQKGIGEIESIRFKGQEMPVEFVQKEEKGSKIVRTSKKPISLSCLIKKKPICQMDIFR
jgi:hypothetical protein